MKEATGAAAMFDAVIIGGGLVGASQALLLAEVGFTVALVEAGRLQDEWQPERIDARVSAITPASQALFESLGLWAAMSERRVSPYHAMQVRDAEGTGVVRFSAEALGVPTLGHIVENAVMLAALGERLRSHPAVTLYEHASPQRLAGAGPTRTVVLVDERQLAAGLIIVADGARSPTRDMAGIGVREYATGHRAIVTTVTHRHDHHATARQCFLPTGPLAFLPLDSSGERHCSTIVWSCQADEAERLMALDDVAFARAMASAFELPGDDICHLDERRDFALMQRHARRYTIEGLALVGDAAHSLHPLAGQGVNLGLMDIAVLAEELERARTRGARLGDERILRRYSRRRRGDNTAMLMAMDAFRIGFEARLPAIRLLRNRGLSLVDGWGPVKSLMMRQALGERVDLPARMRAHWPSL